MSDIIKFKPHNEIMSAQNVKKCQKKKKKKKKKN